MPATVLGGHAPSEQPVAPYVAPPLPGQASGPGLELAYAEIVANPAVATAVAVAVAGLQITLTGEGRAVDIEAFAQFQKPAAGDCYLGIMRLSDSAQMDTRVHTLSVAGYCSMVTKCRVVLAAGVTESFYVTQASISAGAQIVAAAGLAAWIGAVRR